MSERQSALTGGGSSEETSRTASPEQVNQITGELDSGDEGADMGLIRGASARTARAAPRPEAAAETPKPPTPTGATLSMEWKLLMESLLHSLRQEAAAAATGATPEGESAPLTTNMAPTKEPKIEVLATNLPTKPRSVTTPPVTAPKAPIPREWCQTAPIIYTLTPGQQHLVQEVAESYAATPRARGQESLHAATAESSKRLHGAQRGA